MTNIRPIKELLKSFEDFMKTVDWQKSPTSLYLPVDYIMCIGGKRIRPLALLFVTELLEGQMEAALNAAYGVELFHNFTLIHDDIMDQAVLRRSSETVHKKFGNNAAILSGDVMMIDAMQFVRNAEKSSGKVGLQDLFIKTAREVCEGQAMDMEFEKRIKISYDEYLEMIRLKTAVLLAFGLRTAALLSARVDLADSFYDIGIYAGLAFQLEDDWLDFYATETAFGKIKAGDLIQAKKSALVLELIEQFELNQQVDFGKWYQTEKNTQARILTMTNYFEKYGIQQKLRERIQIYQNKTYACIEKMDLAVNKKLLLNEFMFEIFMRKI